MNFGIFVCSKCAGLHRELNHKVKGLAMCKFSKDEIEFLEKWGNEVKLNWIDLIESCRSLAEKL